MTLIDHKCKELPVWIAEEISHQISMIDELRAALAHTEKERMAIQQSLANCLHHIKKTTALPPELEDVLQKASMDEAATVLMRAGMKGDIAEWACPLVKFHAQTRSRKATASTQGPRA